MPAASKRPCPGRCGALVLQGHCAACSAKRAKRDVEQRALDPVRAWYNSPAWRRTSKGWLKTHPMCTCERCNGVGRTASVVDHEPPHGGDPVAFWDTTRFRSMHKSCHDRKTVMRDGGFGRARVIACQVSE